MQYPGSEKIEEFFKIPDHLRVLANRPEDLKRDDYRILLAEACKSFSDALDNGLAEMINGADAFLPENRADALKIIRHIDKHAHYLDFQAQALRKCGASSETTNEMIVQLQSLKKQTGHPDINPVKLNSALRSFSKEVCKAAKQVKDKLAEDDALYLHRKGGLVVGGSLIVISTVIIVSGGLLAVPAVPALAVSTAAGGWMITMGGLLKKPSEKKPK